jgi:hypothetical protein
MSKGIGFCLGNNNKQREANMKFGPLAYVLTSAVLLMAGCGSNSADSESAAAQTAGAATQAPQAGRSGTSEVVRISPRTYKAGSATVRVSGFFTANGSSQLNIPASTTADGSTWLQYGASGAQELNVLITNSEDSGENGVNVGVGSYTVTGTNTSGECQPRFEVTPTKVTGHYQCKGSAGYDKSTGKMGNVDVEVDFDASSPEK